jgi:hypothetical protein
MKMETDAPSQLMPQETRPKPKPNQKPDMNATHYVAMAIHGKEISSSTVFAGTLAQCRECRSRMMAQDRSPHVSYIVCSCSL